MSREVWLRNGRIRGESYRADTAARCGCLRGTMADKAFCETIMAAVGKLVDGETVAESEAFGKMLLRKNTFPATQPVSWLIRGRGNFLLARIRRETMWRVRAPYAWCWRAPGHSVAPPETVARLGFGGGTGRFRSAVFLDILPAGEGRIVETSADGSCQRHQ